MSQINNPILRGFNPDPSILRVENDYYIATSTFEWFPGVQVHHSRDLVNWETIAYPLDRLSQLNMIGNPDSGGVWAPCLSWQDGRFYLIYTDTKSLDGIFKDTPNYLVTAPDIRGPWSEPVYLNSSGFDPSLFHDPDGRKWLVNMLWEHRPGRHPFGGVVLQEYDPIGQCLTGPIHNIFHGSPIQLTEGPHLYFRAGWYYLMVAEGGTGHDHAVSLARSRNLFGPYEIHPQNPLLSAKGKPELALQKAGHGSLVETQNGEWYLAHLCARPLADGRCTLGRETALQKVQWDPDGWLRLSAGGNSPAASTPAPDLPLAAPFSAPVIRDNFDTDRLRLQWQALRQPITAEWLSLQERPGYLRLKGRESLSSRHRQSLIARRQQAFHFRAETCLEFQPDTAQQMAGLVLYYNTAACHYLFVSFDETAGRVLQIMTNTDLVFHFPMPALSLPASGPIWLRATVDHAELQFSWAPQDGQWIDVGPVLDHGILSDEFATKYPKPGWGFTGAFVGLACQDLGGRQAIADFDYFDYEEI